MSQLTIRALTSSDVAAFREVRLAGLYSDPRAFYTSASEFEQVPLEELARRLGPGTDDSLSFTMGALVDDRLVGLTGFLRESHQRGQHKGMIWGVYVLPEVRGRGISRQLMKAVIARARTQPSLEQILLTVASTQTIARQLYITLGFESYGIERRAIVVNGEYLDEELMVLWLS